MRRNGAVHVPVAVRDGKPSLAAHERTCDGIRMGGRRLWCRVGHQRGRVRTHQRLLQSRSRGRTCHGRKRRLDGRACALLRGVPRRIRRSRDGVVALVAALSDQALRANLATKRILLRTTRRNSDGSLANGIVQLGSGRVEAKERVPKHNAGSETVPRRRTCHRCTQHEESKKELRADWGDQSQALYRSGFQGCEARIAAKKIGTRQQHRRGRPEAVLGKARGAGASSTSGPQRAPARQEGAPGRQRGTVGERRHAGACQNRGPSNHGRSKHQVERFCHQARFVRSLVEPGLRDQRICLAGFLFRDFHSAL
mmetsp:Transcript_5036/g.32062  ORF Transcript_5036/g.32062 Transcript_5036/m.32062 type:complete len:311 (-) Transcript_5036:462-1394(-)